MSLSKDLTNAFHLCMEKNHLDEPDITFSIMVLGANFWPLNLPTHDFIIPTEIAITYDRFQKFYRTIHSGRKLTWLWNYSENELRTNYLNKKYILTTSSYQMAVLLQYNKHDTLSLNEIQTATAIPPNILSPVLGLLVKTKVLINEKEDKYDLNPSMFY
jgi:cullin 1